MSRVQRAVLAVTELVRHIALARAGQQHTLQLVVLHIAGQNLSVVLSQTANAAHLLARLAHDGHAAEVELVLLSHTQQRAVAVHREAVGVLEEDDVLLALGNPLLRQVELGVRRWG